MANSPGILERIPELRALTKYRKNEALIRNDGVYVISGIFCRANACVCGKNAFPPRSLAVGGPKGWRREHTQCAAPEHWATVGGTVRRQAAG